MSIRRGNGNLGRTRHKPSVRRNKRPRDREIGTLRPMETKSRATLIESLDLRRVALGPWGSLVYPWWFGTTRLRFKSGRTHFHGLTSTIRRERIARSRGPSGPLPGTFDPSFVLEDGPDRHGVPLTEAEILLEPCDELS